jgi:hypothetical protein
MRKRLLTLTVLSACASLASGCATFMRPPAPPTAPKVDLPQAATQRCPVYRLPANPTMADLEAGFNIRGLQIAECDSRRQLAVNTVIEQQLQNARWAAEVAKVKR